MFVSDWMTKKVHTVTPADSISHAAQLAREKGITLLVTPLSLFSASGRLFNEGLQCCPFNK